ncbi:hypothetical protein BD310DRAFT_785708, partial [Dichomitus squalens]
MFPSNPPPEDAPARTQLTYSLLRLALLSAREAYYLESTDTGLADPLDDTSAGQLFLDLDRKFGDVCGHLLDASNLGEILEDICPPSDEDPISHNQPPMKPPSHDLSSVSLPSCAVSPVYPGRANQSLVSPSNLRPPEAPMGHTTMRPPTVAQSRSIVSSSTQHRKRKSNTSHDRTPGPSAPLPTFRSSGWV